METGKGVLFPCVHATCGVVLDDCLNNNLCHLLASSFMYEGSDGELYILLARKKAILSSVQR